MSYELFAYYYDSLMEPQFYVDYKDFILKHAEFSNVLELGCGTGEIAIELAKKGKEVFATDLSQDMLEVARLKAIEENVDLKLQRVDMSDFSTNIQLDLILCLCDSINYLSNKEAVFKTFSNVFESLKNNGTFIFDVHSLYKTDVIFKDYVEDEEDDEFRFKWKVDLLSTGKIHHYVYIEDKISKEIVEENHYQTTYNIETYIEMLDTIGFSYEYYSDFEVYNETCERVIFVCRKDKK